MLIRIELLLDAMMLMLMPLSLMLTLSLMLRCCYAADMLLPAMP